MMLQATETLRSGPTALSARPEESAPLETQTSRPNNPGSPLGPVKEIVVTLAAPYGQRTLETALVELCEQTAFDLVELRQSSDGLLDHWHARFRLRAPRGIVGDAQIYHLLRCFAGELRWVEISKEPLREMPANLAGLMEDDRPRGT